MAATRSSNQNGLGLAMIIVLGLFVEDGDVVNNRAGSLILCKLPPALARRSTIKSNLNHVIKLILLATLTS